MANIFLSAWREACKRVLRRKMPCWQRNLDNWTSSLVAQPFSSPLSLYYNFCICICICICIWTALLILKYVSFPQIFSFQHLNFQYLCLTCSMSDLASTVQSYAGEELIWCWTCCQLKYTHQAGLKCLYLCLYLYLCLWLCWKCCKLKIETHTHTHYNASQHWIGTHLLYLVQP